MYDKLQIDSLMLLYAWVQSCPIDSLDKCVLPLLRATARDGACNTIRCHRLAHSFIQCMVQCLQVAALPRPASLTALAAAAAAMHLQEMGYNAIHFNQLAHSWLRDVRIHNSDSGFYSWGMVFCTISGLEITSGDRWVSRLCLGRLQQQCKAAKSRRQSVDKQLQILGHGLLHNHMWVTLLNLVAGVEDCLLL
jgi:hypothetical protein